MVRRQIYYDKCNSGDRLAAEWNQSAPACWTQQYQAPFHTYTYTAAGGTNHATLMAEPPVSKCEVNVTMKTNNADAMMGIFLRKARTTITDAGSFWLWCTGGIFGLVFKETGGGQPVVYSVAYVVDPTLWHQIRAQVDGRLVKAKIWPYGTTEPDWMVYFRIKHNEIMPNGVIGFMGTVRTVYYTDIRWTPIPKTGGP